MLYISLTTIPSRVKNLQSVLKSLNNQKTKPDIVIIHCPIKCLRINISYDLNKLKKIAGDDIYDFKVIINEIPYDYGPISKLYPIINLDYIKPDDMIIVIDDDRLFQNLFIDTLVKNFVKWEQKCVVAVSGLLYPKKLGETWHCVWNGSDTQIIEGSFGYILKRDFLDFDFKKWVVEVDDYQDIINKNFENSFLVDDNVISKYLDSKNINKKVILFDPRIYKGNVGEHIGTVDSLCSLGSNLDKDYKSDLELQYMGLIGIDLSKYEKKYFSQNGEDGITSKLIDLLYGELKYKYKYYVEFGTGDGTECNTRYCKEQFGWDGLMMDINHENQSLNLHSEFIHKDNIVSLFKKYNVPTHFNLLSVDIDFNDFYCLHEILKEYDIDIVICEYNATHLPTEDKVVIYEQNGCWDGTNYFGASLLALNKLCVEYGYQLVYCDNKGVNCFFVKIHLLEQKKINILNNGDVIKLYKSPKYGSGPRGGHIQDAKKRKYIDYDSAIKIT